MSNSKNITTKKSNQELITEESLSTIEEKLVKGLTLTEILEDSIYSKNEVTFSNIEGRITGNTLKANSNFTFFELSDISESHVNYKIE